MSDNLQRIYTTANLNNCERLNTTLESGFYKHEHSSDIKRSHLFNDRYENIYLDENHIPEIKELREKAIIFASQVIKSENIKAGLWFNYMPPSSITLPHSHDDYDELMSAVYYVTTPENSGNLLLHHKSETITIVPKAGLFVFFKPDVIHEVSENKSSENRLSIGFNFGPLIKK